MFLQTAMTQLSRTFQFNRLCLRDEMSPVAVRLNIKCSSIPGHSTSELVVCNVSSLAMHSTVIVRSVSHSLSLGRGAYKSSLETRCQDSTGTQNKSHYICENPHETCKINIDLMCKIFRKVSVPTIPFIDIIC